MQNLLREKIRSHALSLGFDLVGFSPAKIEAKYFNAFKDWISQGHHADMSYMEKIQARADMTKILPGAKSVVVLATNYYYPQKSLTRGAGRIARYAYGRDYHKVIGKRLKKLGKFINELAPAILTKSYVDTGPILERALAEQAGLGRIGKNSCLITKEFGSWVFLSEIITNLDLATTPIPTSNTNPNPNFHSHSTLTPTPSPPTYLRDQKSFTGETFYSKDNDFNKKTSSPRGNLDRWSDPSQPSFNVCGNCRKCVDACPTGAIIAPGVVDARLCISYLTIENKNKIPPKLAKIIKKTKRLFGCDICQEVCPHNQARQINSHPKNNSAPQISETAIISNSLHQPQIADDQLPLKQLHKFLTTDQNFLTRFAGSPLMRAKRKGLKRNLQTLQSS